MEPNKKLGVSLPPPLADWLQAEQQKLPYRDRWIVGAAALVSFHRLPLRMQGELLNEVGSSKAPGNSPKNLLRRVDEWSDRVVTAYREESGDTDARVSVPPQVWTGLQAKAEAAGLTLEQFLTGIAGAGTRIIIDEAGAKVKGRKRDGERHGSGTH